MTNGLRKKYTDIELINALKDYSDNHGKTPRVSDFIGKTPSNKVITTRFGSWNNALTKAGLENTNENKTMTDDYLIDKLKEFYNIHGKVPATSDLKAKYGMPSSQTYYNRFGSYKTALIKAGLYESHNDNYFEQANYSDDELLNMLDDFTKKHMQYNDSLPTQEDIDNCGSMPCAGTYNRRLGGTINAYKILGYSVEDYSDKDNKDILSEFIEVIKKYGRIQVRDFEKYNLCSYVVYKNRFGITKYHELLTIAGFNDFADEFKIQTDDEIIKVYHQAKKYFDRIPLYTEISDYTKLKRIPPITSLIYTRWGGYMDFLKYVGDYKARNSGIYYADDGVKCFSRYEEIVSNVLYSKNIIYAKDVLYRDFIKDFDKKYTVDYYLSDYDVYIEVFGMTGIDEYDKKVEEKQNLFKINHLTLISIFPDDFKDNMYNMGSFIMDRISCEYEYNKCMNG